MRGKVGRESVITIDTGITPACAGKSSPEQVRIMTIRITPACAGKRQHLARDSILKEDHPRVCGEKSHNR